MNRPQQRQTRIRRRGFTLVEFLMYSVCASIVVATATLVAFGVISSSAKADAMAEVIYAARIVDNTLMQSVQTSDLFLEPTQGEATSSVHMQLSGGGEVLQVYLEEGAVYSRKGVEMPVVLTPTDVIVDHLVFKRTVQDSDVLEVVMDLHTGDLERIDRYMYSDTMRVSYILQP